MKKNIIYIAIIIILAGAIIAFFVFRYINKPTSTYENETAVYSLSAIELFNEYIADKTAANEKYLGKVIQINGALKNVEILDSLTIIVFAFTEGMFGDEGVRCTMLTKYAEKAQTLEKNFEIKLKGYCTGYNDTDVIIEKCIIME